MRIRTVDFPKFDKRNYAAIRTYFDSVTPWRSKYNPDNERPIGQRACKLTSDGDGFLSNYRPTAEDREGARFNKAMRMLSDGSIAFRLYDTDCVVYHPDDSVTVHGYASVSTNDFIDALTPVGISHSCRGRGRDNAFEPVLHLRSPEHWMQGMVINCDGEVTLNYSVEKRQFVPSAPDLLEPFNVYRIDRKAARQVSREYQLAKLSQMIDAAVALLPRPNASSITPMGDIMNELKEGNFAAAINLMPRGESDSFGKVHGTINGIKPGFLKKLRDHIYDHEGVIERIRVPILTAAQYKRYVADSNRFD